jgi:hypothetical protein
MKLVVVLVVAAVSALLPSAVAQAASIAVSKSGGTLTIAPNAGTRITVSRVNGNEVYVEGSTGDTFSGVSGCSTLTDALNCGTGIGAITFTGSAGNDDFSVSPDITAAVTAHGNAGNDELTGGGGNDQLWGDAGVDTVRGGNGNDAINGGDGPDFILGELGVDTVDGGVGADVMYGGGQVGDTLSYAPRTQPVTVSLAAAAGGAANEGDLLWDFTTVLGGAAGDTLVGGAGNERLDGNGGADTLIGGAGNDALNGGNGDDRLIGGAGADALNGGNDADFLDTRDAVADSALACGAGTDRISADLGDPATSDCEVVAPVVVGDISVSGTAAEGGTLSASFSGQVTGTASTSGWLWWRCRGADCALAGEGATYALTAADAGATIKAMLRAGNDAGTGELSSAAVGPVTAAPPPTPAATFKPAGLSVRLARCGGRRCKITVRLLGDVASLKAVLTRGKKTVASTTKRKLASEVTFRVSAKKTLRSGTYRLKITVTGKDGASKSSTRKIRIRR